jgi:hypothetical protein
METEIFHVVAYFQVLHPSTALGEVGDILALIGLVKSIRLFESLFVVIKIFLVEAIDTDMLLLSRRSENKPEQRRIYQVKNSRGFPLFCRLFGVQFLSRYNHTDNVLSC